MQNLISMIKHNDILELLKTKSSTKQEVYRITRSVFQDFNVILKDKIDILTKEMRSKDQSV